MAGASVPIVRADDSPREAEVREQLDRMLASPRFRNAGNQSDFLKLVVGRALQGKKTRGEVIAKSFLWDPESTDVRVTAKSLRASLKKYEAREGREDLVIIRLPDPPEDKSVKLPEGESYTPRFFYNPNHAVSNAVRLGEYHLTRATCEDLELALGYFSKALEISPGHLRALVGTAETLCTSLAWTAKETAVTDLNEILNRALAILESVMDVAADYWRVQAATGMFLVAVNDIPQAKERFDMALALNRPMTETYPAYMGYLVASGKSAEAVELARRYLNSNVSNPGAYSTCALIMAIAGAIPDAEEVVRRGLKLDRGHPSIRMLASVFKLAEASKFEGHEFAQLATILDGDSYSILKRELVERGALPPDPES
jgi:tetratricopeptide (TPR) repeat protein